MPAPKPVREMAQLPKETQKNGDRQTNQNSTNEQAKHKARLSIEKTLSPTGLYELVLVAVHIENFQMYSLNDRGHFDCSPLFFSWPAPQNRYGQTEKGGTVTVSLTVCKECNNNEKTVVLRVIDLHLRLPFLAEHAVVWDCVSCCLYSGVSLQLKCFVQQRQSVAKFGGPSPSAEE